MKATSNTNIVAGYCDPREDPPARGMGHPPMAGNAFCKWLRVDVRPGRHLIMHRMPPVEGSAVLTVTP